ncbi:exosortase/archaeosortase family protein [Roseimaritima ulvae]|uniref:Transmembrane exosortase (Exosortase_EpsH) n=1 Tax=Roseimaritima ulvae TaxID=980254 RepID=A0A5B9QTW2_9BACT|nr:exosortase/archaeosortase family protein [Roseimaritima ulvae]QEG42468.1 Transmembrane exosortase (Exosortase_EpsH) [Roseimaritima ulvae]
MANRSTKRRRRKPPTHPQAARAQEPRASKTPSRESRHQTSQPVAEAPLYQVSGHELLKGYLPALAAFLGVLLFAYWPTLLWLEDSWRNEPDYSHGYLVLPLAGLLCWQRRELFPGVTGRVNWSGLALIALAVVMRIVGRLSYTDFLDAWSLLPLITGTVLLLFGWAAMKWALPAIGFLFLMIPLPYQAESLLSWKLQGIASELSTVMLRILGQPAVSEGHVIWIDDQRLHVEEACSGMRIFVGVAALAYFWAASVTRSWIDRVILLAAVIPLAVMVNATRITAVGLLNQMFDDTVSRNRIHDWSGYMMIPLAFFILWLVKVYWQRLYRPLEQLTARDFVPSST